MEATFIDGDDHHSPANVATLSGTPLNDDDRRDWLATLAGLFAEYKARGESVVIACSGLKRRYRDRLREGIARCVFHQKARMGRCASA